jgi:hypothetical protein
MKTKYLMIVIVCWIVELLILGYFWGAGVAYTCAAILFPLLIFWGITSGYRKQHKKINHALYPYSAVQKQLDQFDLYRNHKNGHTRFFEGINNGQ